jgi:hypothetical protein
MTILDRHPEASPVQGFSGRNIYGQSPFRGRETLQIALLTEESAVGST